MNRDGGGQEEQIGVICWGWVGDLLQSYGGDWGSGFVGEK